jgi:uncharacterized membrane protein YphA (DoxX/SURF4 family)
MRKISIYIHWALYLWYIYIFGYAGLWKIFNVESMITGMEAFGFNLFWTHVIGWAETIGVVGLIIGFWKPLVKHLSILWFMPFAIAAFTTHMAHREYEHYFNSLVVCILSYLLLATDKHFKISLANKRVPNLPKF